MTLQDLLDELNALPASARMARILVRVGETDDFDILSARYEGGEVIIDGDDDDE